MAVFKDIVTEILREGFRIIDLQEHCQDQESCRRKKLQCNFKWSYLDSRFRRKNIVRTGVICGQKNSPKDSTSFRDTCGESVEFLSDLRKNFIIYLYQRNSHKRESAVQGFEHLPSFSSRSFFQCAICRLPLRYFLCFLYFYGKICIESFQIFQFSAVNLQYWPLKRSKNNSPLLSGSAKIKKIHCQKPRVTKFYSEYYRQRCVVFRG